MAVPGPIAGWPEPQGGVESVPLTEEINLRGVPCPLSWARVKVRLEQMPNGAILIVLLDDPKGARDLPRAAEAEGYDVAEVETDAGTWRIVIQK